MSWILSIANHLQAQNLGTKGTDLFIGVLPDKNVLMTVLTESSGSIIETQTSGIQLKQPSLQVRVRGDEEDYTTPRTRIEAIQLALATMPDATYTGVRILRVKPSGTILSLGLDTNLRHEFSANFEVTYE